MQYVKIDRSKHLAEDPGTGHNRWHPDVTPVCEAEEGEEVVLETRDASDGGVVFGSEQRIRVAGRVHPLTGPVYVKGAQPGDLLEIEYQEIRPEPYGYTSFGPGVGYLPDLFPQPYLVHWELKDGWATSSKLPGVRIPDGCFMGTAGVAPSREMLAAWNRREADLVARGGRAQLPMAEDAVPASTGADGARTAPPRENCGNASTRSSSRAARSCSCR